MACAVCRNTDNVVVNIIMAKWIDPAPDGCYLVEIPVGTVCNIGSYWNGTEFIDPSPPVDVVAESE